MSIIKNFRFPSYFSAIAYFGVGLTASQTEAAVDIIFDYSYDTGGYFDDEKRYILDQVAYAFESRMGVLVLPQWIQTTIRGALQVIQNLLH